MTRIALQVDLALEHDRNLILDKDDLTQIASIDPYTIYSVDFYPEDEEIEIRLGGDVNYDILLEITGEIPVLEKIMKILKSLKNISTLEERRGL